MRKWPSAIQKLLYLSISGFSQQGPLSTKPAMDPVLQAFSGFMMENKGQDGIPHRANPIVVDMSTALYCFQAVSAALYAKRDETKGRFIDASLMAAADQPPDRAHDGGLPGEGRDEGPLRPLRHFPDQGWLHPDRGAAGQGLCHPCTCTCLGLPNLGADPRFQTRDDRVTHTVYPDPRGQRGIGRAHHRRVDRHPDRG